MSQQTWVESLTLSGEDGPALSNSTSATSVIPAPRKITLPTTFFDRLGKGIRLKVQGRISNIVTTPGTVTFNLLFGATTVFTTGAISLNTTAKTNVTFELEVDLYARAIGQSTTADLMGIGKFISESVVGAAAGTALPAMVPASAPAVGNGFDSTQSQTVDFQAQFSIANSGNALTVHNFSIEALN